MDLLFKPGVGWVIAVLYENDCTKRNDLYTFENQTEAGDWKTKMEELKEVADGIDRVETPDEAGVACGWVKRYYELVEEFGDTYMPSDLTYRRRKIGRKLKRWHARNPTLVFAGWE